MYKTNMFTDTCHLRTFGMHHVLCFSIVCPPPQGGYSEGKRQLTGNPVLKSMRFGSLDSNDCSNQSADVDLRYDLALPILAAEVDAIRLGTSPWSTHAPSGSPSGQTILGALIAVSIGRSNMAQKSPLVTCLNLMQGCSQCQK